MFIKQLSAWCTAHARAPLGLMLVAALLQGGTTPRSCAAQSSHSDQPLYARPQITQWSYAEKGDAVFRDADRAGVHFGHAGIYLGCNRWTGNRPLFINAPGYRFSREHPIIDQPVVVTDFQGFLTDHTGTHDFWGVRDYNLSWWQRDRIVAAVLAQQGCKYSFVLNIKHPSTTPLIWNPPYYYMPDQGHATKGDGDFRCDALVEYAYEKAGVNSGQGLFAPSEEAPFAMTPRSMIDRMSGPISVPPEASRFSPAPGSTVSGVVNVSCYLTDQDWGSGVEKADFYLRQGDLFRQVIDDHEADVGDVYHAKWDTSSSPDGPQTIYVTAYDQAGNYKTFSWDVNVRHSAAVSITESQPASYDGAAGFFRHGTMRYWHDAWGVGDGGHMLWTWNNQNSIDNMGDWRPNLPAAGRYEVSVFIPRLHGTTTRARYEVYSADGRSDVVVNQNSVYDAWVSLGTYRFDAGTGGLLRLTDMTGEQGVTTQIAFDTAKWVPH